MSIINTESTEKDEPLFFGSGLSIQRYDNPKYKTIFNSFIRQLQFFWKPEEIDISLDGPQFNKLSDNEKRIFTENLSYQILLDSVQSRGIPELLTHCSNSEFEATTKIWELMETVHSYSYTYMIKNIYPNPTEIFDGIKNNEKVMQRASSVAKYYDQLISGSGCHKKALYLTLISINILEGIRFYVSFVCSWAFAETGVMEGNAKIISLIARDEAEHLAITQNVIKILRGDKNEGFEAVVKECENDVIEMYRQAAEEEMDWARHLFCNGSMLGLNAEILIDYMKWLTDSRMRAINVKSIYPGSKNPISWVKNYTDTKSKQSAPQETEIDSYKIGAFKHDSFDFTFKLEN